MKQYNLIMLLSFLIMSNQILAQDRDLSLIISGKLIMPSGTFGKDIGENPKMTRRAGFDFGDKVGLAGLGYGFGAELISPFGFSGLEWMLSSRFLINSSEGSSVQKEFTHQFGDSLNVAVELGNWINIPIMTGLRYRYLFNPNFCVYGLVQAGINISKAASRKIVVKNYIAEETTFEFARDFGYEFGLGTELSHRFDISFCYLSLSTPRYEGTRTLSEKIFPEILTRKNAIVGEERSISMFLVTIGYHIF